MQTASLGSVVKRSVPPASQGQVVCAGEFFLLQIYSVTMFLACRGQHNRWALYLYHIGSPGFSFSQKSKGTRGGRGMVLMAEKYLLFNFLNIQRDVTGKEWHGTAFAILATRETHRPVSVCNCKWKRSSGLLSGTWPCCLFLFWHKEGRVSSLHVG